MIGRTIVNRHSISLYWILRATTTCSTGIERLLEGHITNAHVQQSAYFFHKKPIRKMGVGAKVSKGRASD